MVLGKWAIGLVNAAFQAMSGIGIENQDVLPVDPGSTCLADMRWFKAKCLLFVSLQTISNDECRLQVWVQSERIEGDRFQQQPLCSQPVSGDRDETGQV
jgi:hypothetical protein